MNNRTTVQNAIFSLARSKTITNYAKHNRPLSRAEVENDLEDLVDSWDGKPDKRVLAKLEGVKPYALYFGAQPFFKRQCDKVLQVSPWPAVLKRELLRIRDSPVGRKLEPGWEMSIPGSQWGRR